MNEKIIYFTKLASISIFSFIKINLLGIITTTLFWIFGFILLAQNLSSGPSVHAGGEMYVVLIAITNPFSSVLFYLMAVASPFLFFFIGNRYILKKLIHRILSDKAEKYLYPVLDSIFIKVKEKIEVSLKNGGNYKAVKELLIQQLRTEHENKWVRRIIKFGVKKVKLETVDFNQENITILELLKIKIIQTLIEYSRPSRKSIWILVLIQLVILLLIWILPY